MNPDRIPPGLGAAGVAVLLLALVACSNGVGADQDAPGSASPVTVVARELRVPWSLAFLPGGDLLVTERPGRLVRLGPDGARRWSVEVPGVRARGEGGLLGLALHPRFEENGWIFLYLTADAENRIERFRLAGEGGLTDRRVLVEGIPAASVHDGGRLEFGPDGYLYATTGDAGREELARDRTSLAGKILRLTDEGAPAPGNPFGTLVHSLGHRNPQGIAWSPDGVLWSTEHGRSGFSSGLDELNRIVAGGDYGWPEAQGSETAPGVMPPVLHSGSGTTWAPGGAAWIEGSVWFTGLRGEALYRATPRGDGADLVAHLEGELGRLRGGWVGPDGQLWFFTSNTDGRGRPRDGDDRLLRVDPAALGGGG